MQELSTNAGYYDLLTYAGLDVLGCHLFGKAKGDLAFAVHDPRPSPEATRNGAYGLVIVGYGSCEGCDVLRSVYPPEGATGWPHEDLVFITRYAVQLAAGIHRGTRAQLANQFLAGDHRLLQWYGHEDGYADAITALLEYIPA